MSIMPLHPTESALSRGLIRSHPVESFHLGHVIHVGERIPFVAELDTVVPSLPAPELQQCLHEKGLRSLSPEISGAGSGGVGGMSAGSGD